MKRLHRFRTLALAVGLACMGTTADAQDKKPNILVIFGDDIGYWNISAYNRGMMGYRTPNIDRIAKEGAIFTDHYAQQSCTAGRAAFITGQSCFRTGLLKVGLRGVLKCKASDRDDPTEDPRFGRVGKQTIEDTGPLTRKRMETVDEEFLGATLDFIDRQHRANTPFFCWFNATRMHIYTHLKPESTGKTGLGIVADGMTQFAGMVGQLLRKLDDLGIAENTIVVWTTDNGAEVFSWPDGGTTPFKSEKNTNWEGGYRVPCAMRWPGVIKPGTEINEITSHEDFVPTLVAAAGESNVKEKLLTGYAAAGKTFKVHLDGYDQRDLLAGTGPGKRQEFFYWTDDAGLCGLRYERAFLLIPAQAYVAEHLKTYVEFPPRQRPGTFALDAVLAKLQSIGGSN